MRFYEIFTCDTKVITRLWGQEYQWAKIGNMIQVTNALWIHDITCYAFYFRAIIERYGAYCLYLYVWDTYGHKLANMISIRYRLAPPLLALGWVWHAFASIYIYIYIYSRHTIMRAYHAYLIYIRFDVSHGAYQSFCFKWYLYSPFYNNYLLFYFLPYIPIHFYSYWCPIAWDIFLFRACRSR